MPLVKRVPKTILTAFLSKLEKMSGKVMCLREERGDGAEEGDK